jgi:hypothetical protein
MKKFLKVVGVVVAIILVLPVFLSSKFKLSRSIEINAPVSKVFVGLTF